MNKSDITERFCQLASMVGSEVFENEFASDCFCRNAGNYGKDPNDPDFQFDEKVIAWIESVITDAINTHLDATALTNSIMTKAEDNR